MSGPDRLAMCACACMQRYQRQRSLSFGPCRLSHRLSVRGSADLGDCAIEIGKRRGSTCCSRCRSSMIAGTHIGWHAARLVSAIAACLLPTQHARMDP